MQSLTIGKRLVLAFGLLLVLLLLQVGVAFYQMAEMKQGVDHIAKSNYVKAEQAFKAAAEFAKLKEGLLALMLAQTDEQRKEERASIAAARKGYRAALDELKKLETGKEGLALLEQLEKMRTTAAEANNRVMELIDADRVAEAGQLYLSVAMPANDQLGFAFDAVTAYQNKRVGERYAEVSSSYTAGRVELLVIALVALLAGMAVAYVITRSIVGPLRNMTAMLHDIADGEGDLTRRLAADGKDEVAEAGRLFNRFVEKLQGIIGQVAHNAGNVAAAATQFYNTSEQLATGTEEMAAQAGTVATASEEMSATSSSIAQSCHQAADSSQEATNAATNGSSVVSSTIVGMERIADRVRSSAESVMSLGARSDQIGAIVATIEDIADQTNLLALNAAIEAARAGEMGRGFAVVADEVRALAERTTKATREISEMIKSIQAETRGAVEEMEQGVQDVEHGTREAARSGEALQAILAQINEVAMQVNQIATAAEEQTATTNEITCNIVQMTEVVQTSSRGAHEAATAASSLSQQAEELLRLVRQFKI